MEDDLQDDKASGLSTNQDPSSISNIGSATQSASLISITENASAQHILEENKLPENKDTKMKIRI